MVQSESAKIRRGVVADWLADWAGDDEACSSVYWADASEFIKYLTANGIELRINHDAQR